MRDSKPTLGLDFDGVCHSHTSGLQSATEISGPPVKGLFEFLLRAREHYDIQIFSSLRSRAPGGIKAMRIWLEHYHLLWQQESGRDDELPLIDFPTTEPAAIIQLDDRGCFCLSKTVHFQATR